LNHIQIESDEKFQLDELTISIKSFTPSKLKLLVCVLSIGLDVYPTRVPPIDELTILYIVLPKPG
jgi:hypothetical protein